MKPKPFANSLTVISAIFYFGMWVLSLADRGLFSKVLNAKSFGADLASNYYFGLNLGSFISNFTIAMVTVWIFGYCWALLYNQFSD